VRVRLGVLLVVVGATLSVGAGEAAAALEPCERASDSRGCTRLTVPLDRTGTVPGTIKLRIERQKAKHAARPPLFLIAGGPGQSATDTFDSEAIDGLFGPEARSRDVVAMDMRGTGGSGALDCPALQRGSTKSSDVAACAAKLGPRRDFYSSVDMAEDIDAVRAELGAERIAIYGASYGTYVAQVYARRFPARVDRLVLDAVVGPRGIDAFERPSMAAVPRVAGTICGKRLCRRFTRDAGADIAALAARLDDRPLSGLVTDRRGRRHRTRIDGRGLLDLVVASDGNPFAAAEIPAAVRNALHWDPAPLLRARAHTAGSDTPPSSSRQSSAAAYVATLCSDTVLPWESSTPTVGRQFEAVELVSRLPADAFAPFGSRTALNSDVLDWCRSWPSRAVPETVSLQGRLPDVPALLLAGGLDVRTPLENARAVAAEMPRARLVVVGHAGHRVLGWDFTSCSLSATRRFLAGGDPGRCGPGPRSSRPFPAAPTALDELRPAGGATGRSGRTAHAVRHTFVDYLIGIYGELFASLVRGSLFDGSGGPVRAGALRGGSYAHPPRRHGVVFDRVVVVPGVRVDGALVWRGRRRGLTGVLKISGPAAAHGRLTLHRRSLRGKLGGRSIRLSIGDFAEVFETSATGSSLRRANVRAPLGLGRGVWAGHRWRSIGLCCGGLRPQSVAPLSHEH
jgi:pimeloyl-ACP methyl ester carboxylesterase